MPRSSSPAGPHGAHAPKNPLRALGAACIGIGMLLAVSPALADDWRGEASIAFHAATTLKDFSGTARAEPFAMRIEVGQRTATLAGTVSVDVARMDTDHRRRDENMRAMFDQPRHPRIVGVFPASSIDLEAPENEVDVAITIRDRTRTVPARISNWQFREDELAFDLAMTLSLNAFALAPPVFMGVIRVGDAVDVICRFRLIKSQP